MNKNYIEFHKVREVLDMVKDSFLFIKENFLTFLGMCVVVALPFTLLRLVFNEFVSTEPLPSFFMNDIGSIIAFVTRYGVLAFFMMLCLVLANIAVFQYVILYIENKGGKIPLIALINGIKDNLWQMTKAYMSIAGIIIAAQGINSIALQIIALMPPSLIQTILIGVVIAVNVYYLLPLLFILPVRMFETERSVAEAAERAYFLVHNDRTYCLGMVVVMGFLQFLLAIIPHYIIEGLPDATFFTVITFTQFFLILGFSFQYFGLVEMKDAKMIKQKLDKLGSTSNNDDNDDIKEDF